jgi:arginine utilization regulatory protein
VEHLPAYMKKKLIAAPSIKAEKQNELTKNPFKSIFYNSQEHYIQKTLEEMDWNISKAAKTLGITRQSLQYHIKKHGLVKPN